MNPQPSEFVGMFWAFVILFLVMYYARKERLNPTITLSDEFIIGHVVNNSTKLTNNVIKATVTTTPKKNKTKRTTTTTSTTSTTNPPTTTTSTTPKPLTIKQTALYSDCIEAMVSLGCKRTYARGLTKEVFDKHNVKTIQEFISIAMNLMHNRT